MLLHSEVLSSCQCHIRHEQTLDSRVFGGVHEGDDAVERTSIRECILKEVVVVVGHTHTAEDDLVHLCTERHQSHHLVERLVRVSKEWNLLTRHQRVVQVDTSNTRCNQFGWLLTTHRVHGWTANLHVLTFNLWTSVDRVSVGIEEASCQLFAHLQRWSLAEEHHFRIGGDATRTFKHLQGHVITCNFHYLSQLAVDGSKLIISHSLRFEGDCGLRNLANLCVYLLKSCSHSRLCGKHCLDL